MHFPIKHFILFKTRGGTMCLSYVLLERLAISVDCFIEIIAQVLKPCSYAIYCKIIA